MVLFFSIVFLLWDERQKRRRAFSVSACTSLALMLCKEGEEACYPFLSHSSLALASFLLTAPTLLQLCSSAGSLVGPRKVQHTQEKSPRISAPLSSPRLASTARFPQLQKTRQAGGPCTVAQPPGLWLRRATPNPRQAARRKRFLQGQGVK